MHTQLEMPPSLSDRAGIPFPRIQPPVRLASASQGVLHPRVEIAGVSIDNLTTAEAISAIEYLVQQRRPSYVVTPNVDHVVRYQHDADFRRCYESAALVLADGMPLLWAARFLRTPLKAKVSGSDLFPRFCGVAAQRGHRLFFMGGREGAAQRAAEVLSARYPGLCVVGCECPPFGFERDESQNRRIIDAVRSARPDVLFIALGAPKQELWMYRHHAQCEVPVSIGVGAAFDFAAGFVRRAPLLMQQMGLEWLWRLALEPSRLYRRYLVDDPRFFRLVIEQWQRDRRRRRRRPSSPPTLSQEWLWPSQPGPRPSVWASRRCG